MSEPNAWPKCAKYEPIRLNNVSMNKSFLQHIANCLTDKLPGQVRHAKIRVYPGKNSVRLYYPELDSSYYEVYCNDETTEIAFRFAGGGKIKNESRFSLFEMHLYSLRQKLEHPLVIRLWQKNEAQVAISLSATTQIKTQAEKYADLMITFIDLTHSMLCTVFEAVPSGSKQAVEPQVINQNHYGAYVILSRHIDQIQAFLQGRANRPTDDILCDWVQFCYIFELFKEGDELFKLIDQSAVEPWLYERAKRRAKICRMRAKRG